MKAACGGPTVPLFCQKPSDIGRLRMEQDGYPGPPKWVRSLIIVGVILVVIFIGLHLMGLTPTGGHGT